MYKITAERGTDVLRIEEAMVCTKYKNMEKKVKPGVGPLPLNIEQKRKEDLEDPTLRRSIYIGDTFMDKTQKKFRIGGSGFILPEEEKRFWEIFEQHEKALTLTTKEIGCIGPKLVETMVIFKIDHVSWNLSFTL